MLRTAVVVVRRRTRVSHSLRLDRQRRLGDVDGEGLVAVDPPEGHLLTAHHHDPVFEARRWTVIGSAEGRGGGPT